MSKNALKTEIKMFPCPISVTCKPQSEPSLNISSLSNCNIHLLKRQFKKDKENIQTTYTTHYKNN